jgi:hypothetical protein
MNFAQGNLTGIAYVQLPPLCEATLLSVAIFDRKNPMS